MGKVKLGSGSQSFVISGLDQYQADEGLELLSDLPEVIIQKEYIEVPVEKIVTKEIEKLVEIVKEVPVEVIKYVDKIVEVQVERIIEIEKEVEKIVEVEKIIEKRIEVVSKEAIATMAQFEQALKEKQKAVKRLTIIIGILTVLTIIGAIY